MNRDSVILLVLAVLAWVFALISVAAWICTMRTLRRTRKTAQPRPPLSVVIVYSSGLEALYTTVDDDDLIDRLERDVKRGLLVDVTTDKDRRHWRRRYQEVVLGVVG